MSSKQSERANTIKLPHIDPELLITALTHKSFAGENHTEPYERLEFLGDSVLGYIISTHLYNMIGNTEGILTVMRSKLVTRDILAQKAAALGLADKILLGNGEIGQTGRTNPNILEDVFEALVGACYLTNGIDVTTDFVLNLFKDDLNQIKNVSQKGDKAISRYAKKEDTKGYLQELAGYLKFGDPIYEYVEAEVDGKPIHQAQISFTNSDLFHTSATDKTKKAAAKAAAALALKKLEDFRK